MSRADAIKGLYVITTAPADGREGLLAATEAALRGGARVVQYRDKTRDDARRHREGRALMALTHRYGGCFIVNDAIELARALGADGIHLGRDDAPIEHARRTLGPDSLIGVSCYNDISRGDWAVSAGADYLAFGSVFPSVIKPDAARAGPELLTQARARFDCPLVAIGGIDTGNVGELRDRGMDAVAVISAVYHADDVQAAARELASAFER